MSLYLSVDMDLIQRSMKKLPPLPGVLLYLAWGASMLMNSEALRSFSKSGIFTGKKRETEVPLISHMAS